MVYLLKYLSLLDLVNIRQKGTVTTQVTVDQQINTVDRYG